MADKPKCEYCKDSCIEFVDGGHGNVLERPCSYCNDPLPTFTDEERKRCIEQTGFDPQIDDDNGGFI